MGGAAGETASRTQRRRLARPGRFVLPPEDPRDGLRPGVRPPPADPPVLEPELPRLPPQLLEVRVTPPKAEERCARIAELLAPCVGSLSIEAELAHQMMFPERAERMRKLLVRIDEAWKIARGEFVPPAPKIPRLVD
jgi:hypothetical protein